MKSENTTMDSNYVLGVDIGGSHITAALLDLEKRSILEHTYVREKINSRTDHEQILQSWVTVIASAFEKGGQPIGRLGIAMPGPFDYEKGISYMNGASKYGSLYELNVKELLAERLGILPEAILLKNDAACFLAGEAFAGAGRGFDKLIGLTLGTGLGTAVLENDDVRDADLWKLPFLDSNAEEYISTRWFLKRYYELTGINVIDVKEMAKFYETSSNVREVFEEFAVNLGNFIIHFQETEKAEAVILGGNISNAASKFLPGILRQFKKYDVHLPIYITQLNEHAALIGAASCWLS